MDVHASEIGRDANHAGEVLFQALWGNSRRDLASMSAKDARVVRQRA